MTRPKAPLTELCCPICHKHFEVTTRLRGKRKYCSRDCANEWKKQQYKGRTYHFNVLNEEKEQEICDLYKQGFSITEIAPRYGVHFSTITRVTRKYNIRRTPKEAKRVFLERHPEFPKQHAEKLKGRYIGPKSARYVNGSGRWKFEVFERDNYTCQDCGHREPQIMEAHHLVPRRESKPLLYSVENGITLCPNCHRRREMKLRHWKKRSNIK